MRRPRILRSGKRESAATTEVAPGGEGKPAQAPGGEGKPAEAPGGEGKPAEVPLPQQSTDPHERIDGLRAWLAQVDRRLGIRTYAIGAAAVLALAAGIVGVVLAVNAKEESATQDEVQALRSDLRAVEQEAAAAAEEQVSELVDRVGTLERQVSRLSREQTMSGRELRAFEEEIDDLRDQIADLDGPDGGGGMQAGGGN
jgi:polyhydroxyalkanoate synthesis regulator phasin